MDIDRKVYQVDFHPPRELAIAMALQRVETHGEPQYFIKFQVANIIERSSPEFEGLLLFDINLPQENVGACGVFAPTGDAPEELYTLTVDWEILPPGERESNIEKIVEGLNKRTSREAQIVAERCEVLRTARRL